MAKINLSLAAWRKSARSAHGENCVEVAAVPAVIAVRDSKNPDGPALVFTRAEWRRFTQTIQG